MKKAMVAVLAICMVLASCCNICFAASIQPTINANGGKIGDTITVTVSLPESVMNDGVVGGSFNLVYDNAKMSLVEATAGNLLSGCASSVNPDFAVNKVRISYASATGLPKNAGTLMTVKFKLTATGTATFSTEKFKLSDLDMNPLSCTDSSKSVTITSASTTVAVTGVSLNKSSATLNVGDTTTLTATVTPSNATNKNVTWTSSNTAVATVSNGVVTAKKAGTATITVKTADGNKTATCSVTVKAATDNSKARFTFSEATGRPGNQVKITLSLKSAETINSVALSEIGFDSNVLIFDGFTDYDNISDLSILPPSFDADKMAIIFALKNATAFDGKICTLNFRIKENATEGVYNINANSTVKFGSKLVSSSVTAGEITVCMQILGDIDGNETVDIDDAVLLFQHSMLPDLYPVKYIGSMDFNNDGTVDIDDAVRLFQYSMLPDLYPLN